MRVILILVLSVFMGSAAAITRCELNGKVYYQSAACPEHAKAQYLIDDKYIDEDQLRKYRQEKEDTMPEEQLSVSEEKPQQVTDSSASSDAETQADDELDKQAVKNAPHVNVPSAFDYVNPKLSDMQGKLDEHNKELQKLQNAQ